MRKRTITAALALLALSLSACGEDFQLPSELVDLRVLMLRAEPIEVSLDGSFRVERVVHVPEGQAIASEQWSFCPFTAGAFASFACVACEGPLTPEPETGEVVVAPLAFALQCPELAGLFAGGPGEAPPEGVELPAFVETLVRHIVTTDAGEERESILRVPVWLASEPDFANRHPVIAEVTLDDETPDAEGAFPAAAREEKRTLRVTVDPDSLDPYQDSAGGEREESPIVSFYATTGELQYARRSGTEAEVRWTAPDEEEEATQALLYVVARDLRGGQALAGPFTIPLLPTP